MNYQFLDKIIKVYRIKYFLKKLKTFSYIKNPSILYYYDNDNSILFHKDFFKDKDFFCNLEDDKNTQFHSNNFLYFDFYLKLVSNS